MVLTNTSLTSFWQQGLQKWCITLGFYFNEGQVAVKAKLYFEEHFIKIKYRNIKKSLQVLLVLHERKS